MMTTMRRAALSANKPVCSLSLRHLRCGLLAHHEVCRWCIEINVVGWADGRHTRESLPPASAVVLVLTSLLAHLFEPRHFMCVILSLFLCVFRPSCASKYQIARGVRGKGGGGAHCGSPSSPRLSSSPSLPR